MKNQRLNFLPKTLFATLSLCLFLAASAVFARDISNEQRAASEARERYNQAKSNNAKLAEQVSAQEKRVTDEQARLKTLQENQAKANTELQSAEADLETKVNALEKVWDERNKN